MTLPSGLSTVQLLTTTDRQEQYSLAYVQAIASTAGYNTGKDDLDRDSEDMYVRHRRIAVQPGGFDRLSIQVKCTYSHSRSTGGILGFPLSAKNYNDLRLTCTPAILVVVTVPDQMMGALDFGADHMIMRNRAYWSCLRGLPELKDPEQNSVTVKFPVSQELTVDSLHSLMLKVAQGNWP